MIVNKRSSDPFDRLIFEKGIRAKQIMVDKKLNTMIILLSNAQALKININIFARLKNASQEDLNNWQLTGNGIGIRWPELDEDLSLKALIKETALTSILHSLEGKKNQQQITIL